MTANFHQILQIYYNTKPIRWAINIIYFICEISLFLYLMIIPIQIAYFRLSDDPDVVVIQQHADIAVLCLFVVHIFLYFDWQVKQILKKPYDGPKTNRSIWYRLISLELFIDIACLILAAEVLISDGKTLIERIVELVFALKFYKLAILNRRCVLICISTPYYVFYRVIKTVLLVFLIIAYVGSLFYAVADINSRNLTGDFRDLVWIINTPAVNNPGLITYPLIVQLEYTMYWALGTASTAAYGDVSGVEPHQALVNVITLLFQGFLFGYYINSMHSIPNEARAQDLSLLQQFTEFQDNQKRYQGRKGSKEIKLDNKLHLKILCFLEYKQSISNSMEELQKILPKQYLKEIKYAMYEDFLLLHENNLFKGINLQIKLASQIKEIICEEGENINEYGEDTQHSLFFIREGTIKVFMRGELKDLYSLTFEENQTFGYYCFITGANIPTKVLSETYCHLYYLTRNDYKNSLNVLEKIALSKLFVSCLEFDSPLLQNDPYCQFYAILELRNNDTIIKSANKSKMIESITKQFNLAPRQPYKRKNTSSRKCRPEDPPKKKDAATQTQKIRYPIHIDQILTT